MGFIREFKEFAVRGNVIDLAIGVVIGSAFGKVVDSVVKDVIMPPIGVLLGGVDFSKWKIMLRGEAAIGVGLFINAIIQFLIIAFTVFLLLKAINTLNRKAKEKEEEAKAREASPEEILLTEIRDLLKSR